MPASSCLLDGQFHVASAVLSSRYQFDIAFAIEHRLLSSHKSLHLPVSHGGVNKRAEDVNDEIEKDDH